LFVCLCLLWCSVANCRLVTNQTVKMMPFIAKLIPFFPA